MTDSKPQAPGTHQEVIALWADKHGERALTNFSAQTGIPYGLVKVQNHRGSIASTYFDRIVKAASRRKEKQFRFVTLELLRQIKPRDKRKTKGKSNGHSST